jgi:hypothetical protein
MGIERRRTLCRFENYKFALVQKNAPITSYFKITGVLTEKMPNVSNLHVYFQITF